MKKKLFKYLRKIVKFKVSALKVGLFVVALYGSMSMHKRMILSLHKKSVSKVEIEVETRHGTRKSGGTSFQYLSSTGNRYTVTNDHICRPMWDSGKEFVYINKKKYKILKTWDRHDLCLVEPIEELPPLKDAFLKLTEGATIYVIGFPALFPKTIYQGEYVSNYLLSMCVESQLFRCLRHKDFFVNYLSLPVIGGNSGSPVLDIFGRLTGVIAFGGQKNIAMSVPLEFLELLVEEYERKANITK